MSDEVRIEDGEETVDGELELVAEAHPVPRGQRTIVVAGREMTTAQAATAMAATGFMAGAATVAVVRARADRKQTRRERRRARKRKEMLQVVASRSFLVDVHLLNRD